MLNTTTTRTRAAAVAAILALVLLAACGSSSSSTSSSSGTTNSSTSDLLGPKDVATGTPVKIGFVYDGRNPNLDQTYQLEFTKAIVKFLNEHKGGIGGRPIDVTTCEAGQANPSKATDCANQMVSSNVVLTVMPDSTSVEAVHDVLKTAKIPLFIFSIFNTGVLTDKDAMFVLYDPTAGVADLPIGAAKAEKVKKVTAVVIDVPAATELYSTPQGKAPFETAGIDLEMIRGPVGQADFTPQMAQVAKGGPTVVHIIGSDAFCIGVLRGLQAANYQGPKSTLYVCVNDAVRKAIGSYLKGTWLSVGQPLGDAKDPDWLRAKAILATYGGDVPDLQKAMNTYSVWMSMWQAIKGMKGDINPATVTATIKSMPNMKIPGGGGLIYRCNGKAKPDLPAVCMKGALRTQLDANGNPSLPYAPVGNGPVPD